MSGGTSPDSLDDKPAVPREISAGKMEAGQIDLSLAASSGQDR